MSGAGPQLPLFTCKGNAWSPEQSRLDMRVHVLDGLSEVFGSTSVDEACPECGATPLKVCLHWAVPTAYCRCGWFLDLTRNTEGEVA